MNQETDPKQAFSFGEPNWDDDAELKRLAVIHESAPMGWDASWVVTEERVANWVRFLGKARDNPKVKILVARRGGEVVGTHWLTLESSPEEGAEGSGEPPVAHIMSLWVREDCRGAGAGGRLKEMGEAWARERGAGSIITEVFYDNHRMIGYNLRRGFQAGAVPMTKRLDGAAE